VVGGGIATLLVVSAVQAVWPELSRVGPLQTLTPSADIGPLPASDDRIGV